MKVWNPPMTNLLQIDSKKLRERTERYLTPEKAGFTQL